MAASARTAELPEQAEFLETSEETEPVEGEEPIEETFEPDPSEPHWIEVRLVDAEDEPVRDQRVLIEISNGMLALASTDRDGVARLDGLPEGDCQICFIDYDKDAWEEA